MTTAIGDARNSECLVISIPTWQIVLVLLLPALYLVNARMPWALGLWGDHDRSYYYAFWLSIVCLYAISGSVVFYFMNRSGVTMRDIGFRMSRKSSLFIIASLLALGLLAVTFRTAMPYESTWQTGWPVTTPERLFWIPVYICAGFFEELVYRGFAISALRGKGIATWLVVLISSIAFCLIHGGATWLLSGITLLLGIMFALIYLWRKSLGLVMVIHALGDWAFLLVP